MWETAHHKHLMLVWGHNHYRLDSFSMCSRVRDAMTADAVEGVGIVTVDPGLVGTTTVVADSKAYTAGGDARERFPSVPHPRFECTEAEHELRCVFSSVRYSRFGGRLRGAIVHSGMLDRMMFMVFLYVDMIPMCWCGV